MCPQSSRSAPPQALIKEQPLCIGAADMHRIDFCRTLLTGIVDTGFDQPREVCLAGITLESLDLMEEACSKSSTRTLFLVADAERWPYGL